MQIESKLPTIGTTIFTVMSQLATEHKAINLGQGFPDFHPDPRLLDAVSRAMQEGHNQYPAMAGVPALRQAIAEKVLALYGARYDPHSEITVTSGATEALMSSIQALVRAGDEVVVLEPFFDVYVPAILLAGGLPVTVPLSPPTPARPRYQLDWSRVEDAITPRTRMLILNFPHNPTGIVLSESDLDALEGIVEKHGITILSDEVYEHIVFEGARHLSLATRPDLRQNTVVISSFGKTYHTTGWKIGYCCAPPTLTAEIRKVHQFAVFTVSSPMQVGLAEYMRDPATYEGLSAFYQAKRDRLAQGLARVGFKTLRSEGTFFVVASYEELSGLAEAEFARWLTVEHGVAVIPVSAFYSDPAAADSNHHLARFCFAKQDDTLDLALERLSRIRSYV